MNDEELALKVGFRKCCPDHEGWIYPHISIPEGHHSATRLPDFNKLDVLAEHVWPKIHPRKFQEVLDTMMAEHVGHYEGDIGIACRKACEQALGGSDE